MWQKSNSYRPFAFFLLVIAFTWIPWLSAVLIGKGVASPLVKVLIAIGGLGPTVSASILLYASKNQALIQDYWHRLFNYQLITTNGYLQVALIFPVVAMVAIGISTLFDQSLAQFQIVPQVRNNWLMIFPFIVFTFLLGPLPEELGWRGHWLDGLRIKFNGLIASLLLGGVWACWHIPLFMIKGYPLQELAGNRLMLFVYFAMLLPKAIIFTYIFYSNNRSTLAAILFHFMGNFVGTIIEIAVVTEFIQWLLFTAIAIYLVSARRDIFVLQHAPFSWNNS